MRREPFRTLIPLLTIFFVCIWCFAPVITCYFVNYDDGIHIYRNSLLRHLSFSNILEFWRRPFEHLYVPMTYTVWVLGAWIAKLKGTSLDHASPIFHGLNLFLHGF